MRYQPEYAREQDVRDGYYRRRHRSDSEVLRHNGNGADGETPAARREWSAHHSSAPLATSETETRRHDDCITSDTRRGIG